MRELDQKSVVSHRARRLLAKVRHWQLQAALRGSVCESAHFSDWANRIRRAVGAGVLFESRVAQHALDADAVTSVAVSESSSR